MEGGEDKPPCDRDGGKDKPPCDFGCGEDGEERRDWEPPGKDRFWLLCSSCVRGYDKENTPPSLEKGEFYVGAEFGGEGMCRRATVPKVWVVTTDLTHHNAPYTDVCAFVPIGGAIIISEFITDRCPDDGSPSSECRFRVFPTEGEAKKSFDRTEEVMLTCTQLEQIFENGGVINL